MKHEPKLSAMRVFTACIGRVWRYWVAGAIMFGRSIKIWYSDCRNLQIVSVAWILQKKDPSRVDRNLEDRSQRCSEI